MIGKEKEGGWKKKYPRLKRRSVAKVLLQYCIVQVQQKVYTKL
jgi:hypothetical protein